MLVLVAGLASATTLSVKNYAQELVDDTTRDHPEILVVMVHVQPTPDAENVVVASNIGRIGKIADEDDLRVIETDTPNYEVSDSGTRFEAELPLYDVSGDTIGAIGLVFPYRSGDDEAALSDKAASIRDALARRISSPANLTEPYPYDPRATTKTHAQKLVDTLLAEHPDVLIAAMHVTEPESGENTIIASNIGRIGKRADSDDKRVMRTGEPNLEVNASGNRFEVELPLLDAAGETIGALGLVFPYDEGTDEAAMEANAEAIRDALRPAIASADALFALDP